MRKVIVTFHEDNDSGCVDNAIARIKNFNEVASLKEVTDEMPYAGSMLTKLFDNEQRNRYYGIRKGDKVKAEGNMKQFEGEARVIDYGLMDNNSVIIEFMGKPCKVVAEWLTIVKRVEDQI